MIEEDARFIQAISVLKTVIGEVALETALISIGIDNRVVCVTYGSVIYTFYLNDVMNGNKIYCNYLYVKHRDKYPMFATIPYSQQDKDLLNYVVDKYMNLIQSYQLINTADNVQDDILFQKYMEMKADDGCELYRIGQPGNMSFFSIFAGFPKMNKSDKLNLYSYRVDEYSQINRMELFKKKVNRVVDIYYRAMDLGYR